MPRSRVVWKFVLRYDRLGDGRCVVEMPEGAKVLRVAEQYQEPALWAECDPEARTVGREFVIVGTGHQVPADAKVYLGTAMLFGGQLVLHVYEVKGK